MLLSQVRIKVLGFFGEKRTNCYHVHTFTKM